MPTPVSLTESSLIECAYCGKRAHVHRQVRGRIQTHYVCSGYVSSGPGICAGFRIATGFLDDAIVDGIQKRLDQVVNPEELRRRLRNLLAQEAQSVDDVARLTRRLADTAKRSSAWSKSWRQEPSQYHRCGRRWWASSAIVSVSSVN